MVVIGDGGDIIYNYIIIDACQMNYSSLIHHAYFENVLKRILKK
jgi:hypothetical protein